MEGLRAGQRLLAWRRRAGGTCTREWRREARNMAGSSVREWAECPALAAISARWLSSTAAGEQGEKVSRTSDRGTLPETLPTAAGSLPRVPCRAAGPAGLGWAARARGAGAPVSKPKHLSISRMSLSAAHAHSDCISARAANNPTFSPDKRAPPKRRGLTRLACRRLRRRPSQLPPHRPPHAKKHTLLASRVPLLSTQPHQPHPPAHLWTWVRPPRSTAPRSGGTACRWRWRPRCRRCRPPGGGAAVSHVAASELQQSGGGSPCAAHGLAAAGCVCCAGSCWAVPLRHKAGGGARHSPRTACLRPTCAVAKGAGGERHASRQPAVVCAATAMHHASRTSRMRHLRPAARSERAGRGGGGWAG
jgi:hypothetical protein